MSIKMKDALANPVIAKAIRKDQVRAMASLIKDAIKDGTIVHEFKSLDGKALGVAGPTSVEGNTSSLSPNHASPRGHTDLTDLIVDTEPVRTQIGRPIMFTVHGQPVSQNAMYQRSKQGRMFMTPEGKAWKLGVASCATLAMTGRTPIEGPVRLRFRFYFQSRRSDWDGPVKGTCDALQGVCFANDRQVVAALIEKKLDPKNPRAYIEVSAAW